MWTRNGRHVAVTRPYAHTASWTRTASLFQFPRARCAPLGRAATVHQQRGLRDPPTGPRGHRDASERHPAHHRTTWRRLGGRLATTSRLVGRHYGHVAATPGDGSAPPATRQSLIVHTFHDDSALLLTMPVSPCPCL